MRKIQQLIEEIKGLKMEANHKSALRVHTLLENNQKLFLEKMDPTDFNYLLRSFNDIVNSNARDYYTDRYKSAYTKQFELLLFHLDKII